MAHHTTVIVPHQQWAELTNTDVSTIRVQNLSGYRVKIAATSAATPPPNDLGAIEMWPGDLWHEGIPIADVFAGVPAGYRVWAYSSGGIAPLSVSHA